MLCESIYKNDFFSQIHVVIADSSWFIFFANDLQPLNLLNLYIMCPRPHILLLYVSDLVFYEVLFHLLRTRKCWQIMCNVDKFCDRIVNLKTLLMKILYFWLLFKRAINLFVLLSIISEKLLFKYWPWLVFSM